MYNLDFQKLVDWLLWSPVRKSVTRAWLLALAAPLVRLGDQFLAFKMSMDEMTTMTGQVCKLEKGLNDRLDPSLRRIRIYDATTNDTVFIFTENENHPLFLPTFLSGSAVDFEVRAPGSVFQRQAELSAFVEKYRLVTKRWRLVFTTPIDFD